jgi:hypothetical protein
LVGRIKELLGQSKYRPSARFETSPGAYGRLEVASLGLDLGEARETHVPDRAIASLKRRMLPRECRALVEHELQCFFDRGSMLAMFPANTKVGLFYLILSLRRRSVSRMILRTWSMASFSG